jgi:HlyD family secretion protein
MEIDMTPQTQEPPASPPQQVAVKEPVATPAATPKPASAPAAGGTGVAHRRGKVRAWLVVVALFLLLAGAGFAWAEYTGTDLSALLARAEKTATDLGPKLTTAWNKLVGNDVPEGFACTNGRVEATKVYITTKYQGRIESVLVHEGDTLDVGQVLANMDTRTLKAQLRQAEAQIQRAKDNKTSAIAGVAQREAEVEFWKSDYTRERRLAATGACGREVFEGVYAKAKAAEAALEAARSQVVESQAAIEAAMADADRLRVDIDDGILVAPRRGRVQYRMAEPGEVLGPGGRVLDTIDLTDVYMLFYLPEAEAGKVTIGAEARLLLDAIPDAVIPASVYFVAPEAQFTPKVVETRTERQKLAFQVRARIDPELLRKYESYVKTGLPGVIYVRLDPNVEWPEKLHVKIPETTEVKP